MAVIELHTKGIKIVKSFENFDWSSFWDDNDYSLKEYVGKKPTDEEIADIEKELGYKLPRDYIELVKHHNGGTPFATFFSNDKTAVCITGIYGTDREKMYSLCGELGNKLWLNEWGYPKIGVAVADTISAGHHMVFLDYRECGKDGDPKVVLVDQEDDYRIYPLADTFEEFIKGLVIDSHNITKEEFAEYSEEVKISVISNLTRENNPGTVIEFLTYAGVEKLSRELMGMLARAYNNEGRIEEAMQVMDMIPEEERDAVWYYRYGYSYAELSENRKYDTEKEALNALSMLEKSVELAKDDEIVQWCVELADFHGFKNILESNKEKFPRMYSNYSVYINRILNEDVGESKSGKIYKKITAEDIKNTEDIWDVLDPVYWTIDIYNSYEDYLKSAKSFTIEQRYLNATAWYFMEVNNGGHFQFLDNSTGIVWEDALNGLRLFGMDDLADNFNKVVDLFGGTIPFDREERWAAMDESDENFETFLDEADEFVYRTYKYDGEFEAAYIKAHPEKFVFEGYYNKIV